MMPEAFAISRRRGGDYEDALTIHHAVLVAGGEGEAERGRGRLRRARARGLGHVPDVSARFVLTGLIGRREEDGDETGDDAGIRRRFGGGNTHTHTHKVL